MRLITAGYPKVGGGPPVWSDRSWSLTFALHKPRGFGQNVGEQDFWRGVND
jgi:hypothetical protein